MHYKKVVSTIVCIIMLLTVFPLQALADDGVRDNVNLGGNSTGGGNSGSAFTWRETQSGYRMAIVDSSFKQVSNTVDFLFSEPDHERLGWGNNFYTNSMASGLSTDKSNWKKCILPQLLAEGFIDDMPQLPIYYERRGGSYVARAGGESFKRWFLNGEEGIDSVRVIQPPPPQPRDRGNGTTRPVPRRRSGSGVKIYFHPKKQKSPD